MYVIGELLQKKWKNIRDRYSRELQEKRGKSGNSSKKKSPYMHSQALMFLEDTVKNRKASISASMDDSQGLSQSVDNAEVESQQEVKLRTECSSIEQGVPLPRNRPIKKKRRLIPSEPKIIPPLENDTVRKEKTDKSEEDYDRHFLLSLLPTMKFIPGHLKLNARIEIMQAISKYTLYTPPISSPHPRHHLYEPQSAYLMQSQLHWQQQQSHHQQVDPLLHQPTDLPMSNQKQPDVSNMHKSFESSIESVRYFKDSKESSVASYITDYDSKEDSDSNLE